MVNAEVKEKAMVLGLGERTEGESVSDKSWLFLIYFYIVSLVTTDTHIYTHITSAT